MTDLLKWLGVPTDVRLFFAPYFRTDAGGNLLFCYGDRSEHFGPAFHLVPTAVHAWKAGWGRQYIICHSAMEAIAFLCYNRHRFGAVHDLSFLALGSRVAPEQLHAAGGDCALVFGRDLLGRLTDIRVAAILRHKNLSLSYGDQGILARWPGGAHVFGEHKLTLNALEKVSGMRLAIRTYKPKGFNSFLEQLKFDNDGRSDQDTARAELCRF